MDCFNGLTFTFDGRSSDMFGLYMAWRSADEDWATGLDREVVRSETNMVKHVPNQYGVRYTDTLPLEFDIFHQDGSPISYVESRHINNWLMQDSYKIFKINDDNIDNIFYKVICTSITDITLGRFAGKHVVMTCDSPFGYMREVVRYIDGNTIKKLNNTSDDGIYYPYVTITCDENYSEAVELVNQTEDKSMLLQMADIPVVDGKKILHVDTEHLMLTDGNNALVPLYKIGWQIDLDENKAMPSSAFYWFRLMPGINYVQVNGTCKVTLKMSFPRKAGQLDEVERCVSL